MTTRKEYIEKVSIKLKNLDTALTKLESQAAAAAGELRREIEKEKKRDIDALRNRLKWRNILAMPAVFILLGIGMAVFKRIRTSAR